MKISLKPCILVFSLLTGIRVVAQTNPQPSSSEIQLGLKKLNVVGSILYMAAHPDDENTRLLAYMAKEQQVRTGYLSLTRGDGGQNLIGNEQAELLGLIRTQELLAARRTDGAEQFFTRANDFGFSKNPEETFQIWNKESILADAVWVIRQFKPDVIICRFPEDSRAGHGHHSASAIIAHEAFKAAADPKRFPEQLKYVQVWQAKRLLWNTFNFGGNNTTSNEQFKLDVGTYNPLLGKGYGEIAADSRSNHKSQGFGSTKVRGIQLEYFSTIEGTAPKNSLFDDVDITWARIPGSNKIQTLINDINNTYTPAKPANSVKKLITLLTEVEHIDNQYWKQQKTQEVKDLIAACAGLWVEAYANESTYALKETVPYKIQLVARTDQPITIESYEQADKVTNKNQLLHDGEMLTLESSAIANALTQPYWLSTAHEQGRYNISDQLLVGKAQNDAAITIGITFNIGGKSIKYLRPLVYKFTDPVRGEVYEPLVIAPPFTVDFQEKSYIFNSKDPQIIKIKARAFLNKPNNTNIDLQLPEGWVVQPQNSAFNADKKNDEQTLEIKVNYTGTQTSTVTGTLKNNSIPLMGYKRIAYEHIPAITLFPPAQAKFVYIDLKRTGKKIGYIAGAGDLVPEALKQVGYQVNLLSENEIMNGDLSSYDAIITGVRLYNVNERIKFMQPKLMEYVNKGGIMLVQYNNNAGLVTNQIGPYPFKVSRDRVTDENAKVTFIHPENAILNHPNKITAQDFDGWIQERGLYFTTDQDKNYTSLLRMNDPNEQPNDGSLIVADYGKGRFVYTSLAFFRELPAGVPGAYRLFVNLISK